MRLVIMVAAFGFALGAPVMAPTSMMNSAEAQATLTQAEMTLQAQIVALAQAGDTEGLEALVRQQIRAGNSAVLARVARRVAALAEQIAATDSDGAAALTVAAITVVSNPSVASSDSGAAEAVGASAANVTATVTATNPGAAATVQVAVSTTGNSGVQQAFVAPPTTTTTTTDTPQPTGNTNTVVVVPPRPTAPTVPDVPVIIEPNPEQGGSPV